MSIVLSVVIILFRTVQHMPLPHRKMSDRRRYTRSSPLFVYLMSSQKGSPYIGIAGNPTYRVRCHNREKGCAAGAKSTRMGAPRWKLRLVIGPFFRGSKMFHKQWRKESRGLGCRITQGFLKFILHMHTGLRLWADYPLKYARICRENICRRRILAAHRTSRHNRVVCVPITPPLNTQTMGLPAISL
jgi:hypothetical protein